ncbi:MAG: glyoxylate/hydroxypyruvate reductase A [Paracoccaceae bacterium]|jgi:glyoxylate/hydroxypyruvate reductase A
MAMLIDIRMPDWMTDKAVFDLLTPQLPGVQLHCGAPETPLPDVKVLAANQMFPGMAEMLPNLELVQKLGAGVETMVRDQNLPDNVRIARLEPVIQAVEIAEYCLAEVLAVLRNIRGYHLHQQARRWLGREPRRAAETTICVLGLGHIGAHVAAAFERNGFPTTGWSRSQKTIDGVECLIGPDGLKQGIGQADFVVSVLPSTPETRRMANDDFFASMKPGAILINVGRGDLVVDNDLLAALDKGQLGGAILDVFNQEPLDSEHPFWSHELVAITPHVSGWSLGDGILDVAENYKRLIAGQPLLREIDRTAGY